MTTRYFNQQRGSILIFSVLLLTVILTIGLSLIGVFLPKLHNAYVTINAAISLYAADSASELCLYEARKLSGGIPLARPLMTNGSDFIIASRSSPEVIITNSCIVLGSGSFSFRATGRFGGSTRALEVTQ